MGYLALEKDRLGAFMDAVVAIIMTILVLELERPEQLTWAALWDMRMSFVAYVVSFFGIAVMWTTWHRDWYLLGAVSTQTVWAAILVLFAMSLVPYTTRLVVPDFSNGVAQTLYALVAGLLTLANSFMYAKLAAVSENTSAKPYLSSHARLLSANAGITFLFMLAGMAFWPPLASFGIVVSSVIYVLPIGKRAVPAEERKIG
jgi:uncharacterized membrane protein